MKQYVVLIIAVFSVFFMACGSVETVSSVFDGFPHGKREINKGTVMYKKGCYRQSLRHFYRAHEIFSASDDLEGVALSLNSIGNIYMTAGNAAKAEMYYEEALQIYTRINNRNGTERCESAGKTLDRLEDMVKQKDDLYVSYLRNKGIYFLKQKAYIKAEKALNFALDVISNNDLTETASVNFAMGNLMMKTERIEEAIDFFMAALFADKKTGFSTGIACDLEALGRAYFLIEKNDESVDFFKRSIKIYAMTGNREKVETIAEQLAIASKRSGVDTGVTVQFVKKWAEGDVLTSFCE
ncbi:MAG: tetratricopeptide repeat protein [Deltaproteobacteria bacterium]|nr:tetratricopeptide repeat protein [Deltaproteobacteria bacterium]